MHLLQKIGRPPQIEHYLRPLAEGRTRSAFAMTEPAPGAGSDPAMLITYAERFDGGWSIDGRKWYITGATGLTSLSAWRVTAIGSNPDAARDLPRRRGKPRRAKRADRPVGGPQLPRRTRRADLRRLPGGRRDVLGEGYRYAQVRLGPARLTHCMCWLGVARRALDIALDRAYDREGFGVRLLGMVQQMIADSVIDRQTSRAADLALRLGGGPRRRRTARVIDGKGAPRGGRQSCQRPRDPDLRLPRGLR